MRLSPKQKRYWNEANCRWNVKYGATRSGKTYLDYFVIPRRLLAREGRPGLGGASGQHARHAGAQRAYAHARDLRRADGFASARRRHGTLFGQRVHCLGADNKRHVDRLRGASIKYCYGDEVVSWEREVFEMLKSRLDKEYSCFDGTCNPGGPGHWFKKFLDSGADVFSQQYGIDDNPFLPESVRAALKREYTGRVLPALHPRPVGWRGGRGLSDVRAWAACVRKRAADALYLGGRGTTATPTPRRFIRLGLGEDGRVWALEEYYPRRRRDGGQVAAPVRRRPHQLRARQRLRGHLTPRRRASSCSCTRTAPPCG